jgi:SAM-dependent methyltransferase
MDDRSTNSGTTKDVWAAGKLYEPYVGRWSRLVARDFLAWIEAPTQCDWLDVGCGTGALTEAILETVRPRGVKGIDPSAGFIEYARAHITNPKAAFEVADAQSLPVKSASFDVAVSGLVLNFVPQPSRAVAEMARAVRSQGTIAAYVWDYAGKMELMRYFWDAAVALDPAALALDAAFSDLPARAADRAVHAGWSARSGSAGNRCAYPFSRFRRLLDAVSGRTRSRARLCDVTERGTPRRPAGAPSRRPPDREGWRH